VPRNSLELTKALSEKVTVTERSRRPLLVSYYDNWRVPKNRIVELCSQLEQNTNNQQPTTNNQQPTTNNQQPTTNNQQLILPRNTNFIKNHYPIFRLIKNEFDRTYRFHIKLRIRIGEGLHWKMVGL